MKISALHAARLVAELEYKLPGARIQNLSKSEIDKTVVIQLKRIHELFSLVFHFGSKKSFLYYLDRHHVKIKTTNFLPQLLNGEISGIKQIGMDRIVEVRIGSQDADYRIIFELFGQNSNLLFLDKNDKIITALRKATKVGDKYFPPELSGLINPIEFDIERTTDLVIADNDSPVYNQIIGRFAGMNPDLVSNIFTELNIDVTLLPPDIDKDMIGNILSELQTYCRSFVNPDNVLCYDPVNHSIYVCSNFDIESVVSISHIFSQIMTEVDSHSQTKKPRRAPMARVKRALKRDRKRLDKLENRLIKSEKYHELQKMAELLSVNSHKLVTGMKMVELEDFYSDDKEKIKIELIKSYSPGKNIARYFSRAKKLKDKIPALRREIDDIHERLEKINQVKTELEQIEFDEIPEQIAVKLRDLGIIGDGAQRTKKSETAARLPYKQYTTSNGEIVMVGRSARDNDHLTFKIARKNDLWFHSQQSSGSHVVLKRPSRNYEFQKACIIEAAEIAAFFSTAKNSESVSVIYTEIKYVRKAKKGKPGQVLADRVKSLLVTPHRPKN